MSFKKFDSSTWQSITPKKLKGIPYTGTLPATLTGTKAGYLYKYKLYGNTVQDGTPTPENPIEPQECGERTGNLLSEKYEYRSINASGAFSIDNKFDLWLGEVVAGYTYTISNMDSVYGFFTEKPFPNTGTTYDGSRGIEDSGTAVVTVPSGCTWIAVRVLHSADNAMLNLGSTPLPYEPYGYKLPLTSAGQDVDIYLGDDTLSTDEYVDSGTGKIYRMVGGVLTPVDPPVPFPPIPTSAGSTTISWTGEGLAPSEFDSIQEWVDTPTYTYTNGAWVLKKWSYIKALVNAGVHQQYFQLGDQLTCTRGNNTIVWDIVDMTATDMTLLMHDCPFNLQFDSVEAMFAFDGGLAAGTYHFTITNQPWYAGDVGKVVQFTLTEPIPAGGQLVVQNNSSATMIGAKINSYASGSSDTVIESATMSEGSDGTDLGSLTDAGDPTNGINSVQRGLRGNSRWSTSAIRQFLNSDGAEGSVWTPQTPFDRLPSWASSQAGFKNGLEADFLSAITPNTNTTVLNTVSDGGGVETTTDMFYLPSRTEIYGTNEISGSPEGSQYDYYIGTDNDAKIKRWNNSAVNWWLRTPISSSANLVRVVNTSGAATNYNALNTIRVAAACVIRAENA